MPSIPQLMFIALGLATLHPAVPAGGALVGGIVFALSIGNPFPALIKRWTSPLLQTAVIGLGFGMNLLVVGRVGLQGIGYTAFTILLSMVLGSFLGTLLRVSQDASLLISSGTAICGGSAIAAISAAIRAESEDVSVALATVFLLNAAALLIFPALGHQLGFTPAQFGLWSALAVHDTSSVVGTSIQYGAEALEVGTTVKLARALWITPLTLGIGFLRSRNLAASDAKIAKPWFILGFIAAAALVTYVPALQPLGLHTAEMSRRLLVLTLFFIGSNLTLATLKKVGAKPMIQGVLLWLCAAAVSAFAIRQGLIHL